MIVDPYTGQIVDLTQPSIDPTTMSGEAAISAAQQIGVQSGGWMNVLAEMPTAMQTMGWNAWRGGNTILKGGFSNRNNPGKFARNHLMPRSFGRMSSIYNVDPTHSPTARRRGTFGLKRREMYSPFNALARVGNMRQEKGEDPRFSRGFAARMNASTRIAAGGKYDTAKVLRNINALDPELGKHLNPVSGLIGQSGMSHMTMASMGGVKSQKIGGYIMGARTELDAIERSVLDKGGKSAYLEGVDRATRHLAGGDMSIKGGKLVFQDGAETGFKAARSGIKQAYTKAAASEVGEAAAKKAGTYAAGKAGIALGARGLAMAVPGLNVVMAIDTALQVGQMASAGIVAGMETMKDAGMSMKGDLGKGIMGAGYRDTAVAATSRSRGVMAIQNSRLNARSVLGSEASSMHAHFG